MHRRMRAAVLAGLALTAFCPPVPAVQADTLSAQRARMNQLQQEAAQNSAQLAKDQTQAASIGRSLQAYKQSIAAVKQDIAQNQQNIHRSQLKLQQLNAEVTQNEAALAAAQNQFREQLRAMYETGEVPYLEVLFSATSFDDFLSRLDAIATVARKNRELAQYIANLEHTLAEQRDRQQSAVATLMQQQQQLMSQEQTYKMLVAKQQAALQEVNQRIQSEQQRKTLLESQIRLTKAEMAQIEAETRQIELRMRSRSYVSTGSTSASASTSASTSAPASASASSSLPAANGQAIVQYAESFIGTPYVWGGTSPSGFDCSGFTQYVFRHFGISLGRTALDQFGQGIPVDISQLQPGDLVFFSTYAPGATHVGIYIGNGQMVDAQDEGVTIASIQSSYWGPRYIGARRVIHS